MAAAIVKYFAIILALGASGDRGASRSAEFQVRPINDIKKDMTADEVRNRLGKPDRVARQILFRRHLEQWIYDDLNVRIEFNCLPAEEPRVINVSITETRRRP